MRQGLSEKEFQSLECKSLTPSEREDRRIFAILLSGGDLREHRERDVLVLKDHMGLPAGELPLEYARHFEETYRDATVITVRQKPKTEQSAVPAAMAVAN